MSELLSDRPRDRLESERTFISTLRRERHTTMLENFGFPRHLIERMVIEDLDFRDSGASVEETGWDTAALHEWLSISADSGSRTIDVDKSLDPGEFADVRGLMISMADFYAKHAHELSEHTLEGIADQAVRELKYAAESKAGEKASRHPRKEFLETYLRHMLRASRMADDEGVELARFVDFVRKKARLCNKKTPGLYRPQLIAKSVQLVDDYLRGRITRSQIWDQVLDGIAEGVRHAREPEPYHLILEEAVDPVKRLTRQVRWDARSGETEKVQVGPGAKSTSPTLSPRAACLMRHHAAAK